jgi:hypothetical protein
MLPSPQGGVRGFKMRIQTAKAKIKKPAMTIISFIAFSSMTKDNIHISYRWIPC